MRKIEQNFSYVDHIRFRGINAYNSYYSLKLYQNLKYLKILKIYILRT